MRGTRLWQRASSPLIEGRSRRERAFSADWFVGAALGWLGVLALALLLSAVRGASTAGVYVGVAVELGLPLALGAAAGSLGGVWLARQMGWRPSWLSGLIGAGVLALVAWVVFVVTTRGA